MRNIILLVADGAGAGLWSAATQQGGELAVADMPVVGLLDTRSASSRVTDSAAGAVALATGQRVTNRTIAMGGSCPLPSSRDTTAGAWPEGCTPLETWFALARQKGRAAGIVTTTYVVDATPAAFVAHAPSRYWRAAIAEQFAAAELEVLLGGGRRYFSGETRADGVDLLGPMCARADCLHTAAELAAYRGGDRPLIGLLAPLDMDAGGMRTITLPDMVAAALTRLGRDPDGFVAVFETEATDNATHDNAPLEEATAFILEFDRAVGVALDFARRTPGTLVIAASDHETGGFALVEAGTGMELRYASTGHTAGLVPLFAAGPQAERFAGLRPNTHVGQVLFDIVRGW